MLGSSAGPLKTQILVSLLGEPYNFNEKAFRFNLTAFGGDRYICLKAPPSAQDTDPQVGIVDMYDDFSVERRTTRKADGAMKHPSEEIMVLRGHNEGSSGQFIQVFDLTTKQRLGEHAFDQDICLWRFIHERTLVLVSGDDVYHWDIRASVNEPETSPQVLMKREGRMASTDIQVINYCVDDPAAPQWALLAGIYLEDNRAVRGCLQLYSVEKKMSQFLAGYAGCFGTLRTKCEGDSIQFFSFVEKKPDGPMKLYVMDIYAPRGDGHPTPFKQTLEFAYPPEFSQDFPISAHFSKRHGLVFLVSKNGHCIIFDALSATPLHTERVSKDGIFLSQADGLTGGVKLINRRGNVMRVYVDEDNLIDFVSRKNPAVAQSLSDRYCYKQSRSRCHELFESLLKSRNYKAAAMICALSKGEGLPEVGDDLTSPEFGPYLASTWLRQEHTLNLFRTATATPDSYSGAFTESLGAGSPLLQYFTTLLSVPCRLTLQESLELCRAASSHNKISLLRELIFGGRLKCTEAVGDLIAARDKALAGVVYAKAKCLAKIIGSFIEQNNLQKIYQLVTKSVASANTSGLHTAPAVDVNSIFRQISSSPACMSNIGRPDYLEMLIKFSLIEASPRLIDPLQLFTLFVQSQQLNYITSVLTGLVNALAKSVTEPELAILETRVLEANISSDPSNAELIFQQNCFQHFDRAVVGRLAERQRMYKRALECSSDFADVRRVIAKAASEGVIGGLSESSGVAALSQEWFNTYLTRFGSEEVFELLRELLANGGESLVIQYARGAYEHLGLSKVLELFENSVEGTFYFTGSVLSSCRSAEVHTKYIQSAALLENWQECERVIRESNCYDATKVKDFLKALICKRKGEAALRCLTCVCDLHDEIGELTEFLYRENALEFLELYVTRVNPEKTAEVISLLLNLGTSDEKILEILEAVRGSCNVEAVVGVMESRDRLPLILSWMEARLRESGWSVEGMHAAPPSALSTCLHNSIAKVYVDRRDPGLKNYLESPASGYDCETIGRYCENKDPHMAVLAYSRGHCDRALVALTNRNGLYRIQAKYLLQREDDSLWDFVLSQKDEDEHRRGMLDQLLATALVEAREASSVLCAVKALARNQLSKDLVELLERVVIHHTLPPNVAAELANSQPLQNLLLVTCMQTDPQRAQELVGKLDRFDANEAARAALAQGGLDQIALAIYAKNGMHLKALEVMLETQDNLAAAEQYAASVHNTQVWTTIASYCLRAARRFDDHRSGPLVAKAMIYFAKVDRCAEVQDVIDLARKTGQTAELITFLKHLRQQPGAPNVDTELAYSMALAQPDHPTELEHLLSGVNTVNCQRLGDKLFEEAEQRQIDGERDAAPAVYRLAKLFYSKVPNFGRMTTCLVRLGDNQGAFELAKKAGSSRSWLEVALASIAAGDWSVAELSASHVVEHGGELLEAIVQGYEAHGRYEDLVRILENGCKGTSNIQLLTELGAAYARYQPEKVLDFLKRNGGAGGAAGGSEGLFLNVPKLIKTCEKERQWRCVVVLYQACQEFDQALLTVLRHPESCWEHSQVCELLQKTTNPDLLYQTVTHYIDEHPDRLNDLLVRLSDSASSLQLPKLVHTLTAHPLHTAAGADLTQSPIALVAPFLELEQKRPDCPALVNDLLNDLYLAFEDVEKLRHSVLTYPKFDQPALARRLEDSDLLALQQLALILYKEARQYEHAIALAKKFQHFPEAIAIAVQSGQREVAEQLLTDFVTHPAYFSACLQICAHLIRPELAIELAWAHNITSEIMPFVIHTVKNMNDRLAALESKLADTPSKAPIKNTLLNTPALPNGAPAFSQHNSNPFVAL